MTVEKVDKPTLMIGKHVSGTGIGAVRNWGRNVVLWNLAADSTFEPHTNKGGCAICGERSPSKAMKSRAIGVLHHRAFFQACAGGVASHRLESAG